jgi:hypothetical protein
LISWSICWPQIRSWDWILKSIIREFQPHDQSVDLLINIIGQIRPHEQTQFRPHEKWKKIWSHEFDLMKKRILISWNSTSWPWVFKRPSVSTNKLQMLACNYGLSLTDLFRWGWQ